MTRFRNRRDAGRQLAEKILRDHIGSEARGMLRPDAIVLGIPRGGIVVADEIAQALDVPLDVWITPKIGAPFNAELALGAVASDGTVILDRVLIRQLHIPEKIIEQERAKQMREIQRRAEMYRRGREPLVVENKTVILADDGIATGATTIAALRALKNANPARVILAAPVAPRQVVAELRAESDELVIFATPEPYTAVGYFYEDFGQVTDAEVLRILTEA